MQDCNLFTCEGLRGKEMAESSDAIKQVVKGGLVPSSSTVSPRDPPTASPTV